MPRKSPQSFPTPKKKRPAKKPTADRARFLIDQCPHKITGAINIPGLQIMAPEHESGLESMAIKILALCIDVAGIESQTEKVEWIDREGNLRKYTLDIKFTASNGDTTRLEIKPIGEIFKEEMLEKLVAVATTYRGKGQRFDILTDEVVLLEPRLSIAVRLRGFLTQIVPDEIRNEIERQLKDGPKPTCDLLKRLGGEHHWSHVLALVAQRMLCISWEEPISKQMRVSLPNRPYGYLSYENLANSGRFRPLLQDVVLGRGPKDQQLLAIARSQDRSVSLPSPMGIIGALPKRALQVDREARRRAAQLNGRHDAATTGTSADAGGMSHEN